MSASTLSQDRDSDRAARDSYAEILHQWNERNAKAFAELFTARGNMIGFDGTQVNGREEIETHLAQVFGGSSCSRARRRPFMAVRGERGANGRAG